MSTQSRFSFAAGLLAFTLLAPAWADDDPPGSIARLDYFDGSVTLSPAGLDDWSYATLNRPLTTGDRLWSDRGSRAELHAGGTALRLGAETSLDFLALDDSVFQMRLGQGTLNVRVRDLWDEQSVEVDTPNLALVASRGGEFRLDVDPRSNTTMVSVSHGEVTASGSDGGSITLAEGEMIRFSGTQLAETDASDGLGRDRFDGWVAERDRREDTSESARYVSRDVVGYEDLDSNGQWETDATLGAVWIPRLVVRDWAPYRYGHWAWVAPWGWTWVDDAPWGFAPFHYGRWAWVRGRWGWVPGPRQPRPVYAPALVAFANGGPHWGVSVTAGMPVAWFPLAPGEVYRPGYRVSDRYLVNVNHTVNITQVTQIHNTIVNNIYINQRMPNAITAVLANNFVKGQPVQHSLMPVNPAILHATQTVGTPPLAPSHESMLGAGKPGHGAPADNRPVVGTRPPIAAPALHDLLANQFASHGGTVAGVAPPAIHTQPAHPAVVTVAQPTHQVNLPTPGRPQAPGEHEPSQVHGVPPQQGHEPHPESPAWQQAHPQAPVEHEPQQGHGVPPQQGHEQRPENPAWQQAHPQAPQQPPQLAQPSQPHQQQPGAQPWPKPAQEPTAPALPQPVQEPNPATVPHPPTGEPTVQYRRPQNPQPIERPIQQRPVQVQEGAPQERPHGPNQAGPTPEPRMPERHETPIERRIEMPVQHQASPPQPHVEAPQHHDAPPAPHVEAPKPHEKEPEQHPKKQDDDKDKKAK